MTPCSVYAAVAATASLIAGWQVICGVMSLPCASSALSIAFEGTACRSRRRGIDLGHVDRGDGLVAEHVVGVVRRVQRSAAARHDAHLHRDRFVLQTEIFSAIVRNPELSESRVKL
jgi:hypothetical protein